MLTTAALVLAVGYFIGIVALNNYLKVKDQVVWTVSYEGTHDEPEHLPIIFMNVAGMSSAQLTPYTVSMRKVVGKSSVETINYCAPESFIADCWGNTEVSSIHFKATHTHLENEVCFLTTKC